MSEQPAGEKTLPATPRKIQQARERGNVAKSQDLNSSTQLLLSAMALYFLGPLAMAQLLGIVRYYFMDAHAIAIDAAWVQYVAIQALFFMVPVVVPMMLILMAGGFTINVAQLGFLMSPQAVQPKPERINPIQGFRKFFSLRSLVELIKSLAKLAIISYIAYLTMRGRIPELLSLMHVSPRDASVAVWQLVFTVWWRVGLAMLALGILDYGFQRWQHLRDLRMTQQEMRDEIKQLEGDPRIRQRVRQIQRQLAQQRMMAEVPEADVVITNPTTYAVALRYDAGRMDAPRVIAKGIRRMAERIRDTATEHGVPIVERPELARSLYRSVEIGGSVPEDLFRAVAEVLAYVYRIDRRETKLQERAASQAAAG
jgi:flagellar biosynthesis protein FlhB